MEKVDVLPNQKYTRVQKWGGNFKGMSSFCWPLLGLLNGRRVEFVRFTWLRIHFLFSVHFDNSIRSSWIDQISQINREEMVNVVLGIRTCAPPPPTGDKDWRHKQRREYSTTLLAEVSLYTWPYVLLVWNKLLCLCSMNNSFTCLVKSKPVKLQVSRTVIHSLTKSQCFLDKSTELWQPTI